MMNRNEASLLCFCILGLRRICWNNVPTNRRLRSVDCQRSRFVMTSIVWWILAEADANNVNILAKRIDLCLVCWVLQNKQEGTLGVKHRYTTHVIKMDQDGSKWKRFIKMNQTDCQTDCQTEWPDGVRAQDHQDRTWGASAGRKSWSHGKDQGTKSTGTGSMGNMAIRRRPWKEAVMRNSGSYAPNLIACCVSKLV